MKTSPTTEPKGSGFDSPLETRLLNGLSTGTREDKAQEKLFFLHFFAVKHIEVVNCSSKEELQPPIDCDISPEVCPPSFWSRWEYQAEIMKLFKVE